MGKIILWSFFLVCLMGSGFQVANGGSGNLVYREEAYVTNKGNLKWVNVWLRTGTDKGNPTV